MSGNNINPLIENDCQERLQALNPHESFIIHAPAGSGKTELLIQRFLTLLNQVSHPEEILAITFTKKAANEMRLRIIKALKQAHTAPEPESSHAKLTWELARRVLKRDQLLHWNLLENPNQLRLQTIDSLCAYLTKQLPLLSHFGSPPSLTENPLSLYREAAQAVLKHVEENNDWSSAIAALLMHLNNDLNKLHELLINLLAKRDQWLPYLQFNAAADEIKTELESHLALVIRENLRTVHQLFPSHAVEELIALCRYAAHHVSNTQPNSAITACLDIHQLPGEHAAEAPIWLGIAALLLTAEGEWRKSFDSRIGFPAPSSSKNAQEKAVFSEHKKRMSALLHVLQDHEALRKALINLWHLPSPYYQHRQWEALAALFEVLKIAAAELRLVFQQHGQIDFIENAQAALLALGDEDNPTDLALALDYQIRHVLVDEFQDTSFTQYQLLKKLTAGWQTDDGRTLFVVGDPMQSIYRFREAEVSLFMRMCKEGIGQLRLIPLTLSINFRSTAPLVEWNNAHFYQIFPRANDVSTGAVTYCPSAAFVQCEENTDASPLTIKGLVNGDDASQANEIVQAVQALGLHHPQDKIAILVRSRTHLHAIMKALKKANIMYQAVDIDPLAARQSIQDLISLTCALLHPADRIAWLAVLRAPWCGLSLADLLIIAGNGPHSSIWQQLENEYVQQQLSVEGQSRLAKLMPILKTKIAERQRDDVRTWIESTWLLLGGPAVLQEASDIDDANAFFHLLSALEQEGQPIHFHRLNERSKKLFAPLQTHEGKLQIMTIHSAKGLEFDHVILPHLERKMPHDDKPLLLWMEQILSSQQIALLLAPIHATGHEQDPIYEYIFRQQKIKSYYETDRLLYVAATRAKKSLHLFFNVAEQEAGKFRIESGSFLEKLWPLFANKTETILCFPPPSQEAASSPVGRPLRRLRLEWQNIVHDIAKQEVISHQKQNGFMLSHPRSALMGVVTHQILYFLAEKGLAWWQKHSSIVQKQMIKYQLQHQGILPADCSAAVESVFTAIHHTLNDERGRWILCKHKEARSEFAITAFMKDKFEKLVIDRTFIDETGTRWIIDYKTTAHSPADLSHFLDHEQQKYLEKMHLYQEAILALDPRPIRLGLYFPALPAWKEW